MIFAWQAEIFRTYFQKRSFAEQKNQYPCAGCRLRYDGGERRALYAHAERIDEERVERDVGDRADEYGKHTRRGKALCGNEGVHPQA